MVLATCNEQVKCARQQYEWYSKLHLKRVQEIEEVRVAEFEEDLTREQKYVAI